MHRFKWLTQLFADGGGDGGTSSGGESAAASGVTAADAAQQQGSNPDETIADRLRQMGVPDEMLKNKAYQRKASELHGGTPRSQAQQGANPAAGDDAGEESRTGERRMTWREIMNDPEYKAEMSKTIQRRVSNLKPASDAMQTLQPALEMLAQHYGLDAQNMDYAALNEALMNDDTYFEQRAIDLGVSVDMARKLDAAERLEAARRHDAEMSEIDRQNREHFAGILQQAETMKGKYPGFDLDKELQDERFVRMTSPGVGMSVEDAYFAIHRDELMSAARQNAVQNLSNSIQARAGRPDEGGARKSGNAAPGKSLDTIRNMSKERRDELIRRAQNGERITDAMLY